MSERYVVVMHGQDEELRGAPSERGMKPFTDIGTAERAVGGYVNDPTFAHTPHENVNSQSRTIYRLVPVRTITVRKRAVTEIEELEATA